MTLFIQTPKRKLYISEIYIMALSFLIFFAVGKICNQIIKKRNQNNTNQIETLRGEELAFEFSDDSELANVILTCIADNKQYLVKDPEIIKLVFALVKAKIKDESLRLTPNFIRFLSLKLLSEDQTLMVKIGNIVVSSENRARLFMRVGTASIIGLLSAFVLALPYAILMLVVVFDVTENCGYKCSDYFEQLPEEGPAQIYAKESTGHLLIAGNDDAQQIEIYIPAKNTNEISISSNGELKKIKTYVKSSKKAKEVKFSEFKKTDPVLSSFKDLDEPEVPQKICPLNNIHDGLDIRVK